MIPQAVVDIAEICVRKGIEQAVICPGSRSAPLTLSFARHPKIKTRVFPDERSAGYIACGMARSTGKPVVVVTTSGTAACNLSPAIAEAFYQQIPLIAVTADRPPEWIDQSDNQAVRQRGLYGRHVKERFELPVSYDHPDDTWYAHRIISEALNLAQDGRQGPVHINVPLREPLYPAAGAKLEYSPAPKIIEQTATRSVLPDTTLEKLKEEWLSCDRKLIAAGQFPYSNALHSSIGALSEQNVPVLADIVSNLHAAPFAVKRHDLFLNQTKKLDERLKPDLLITFGKTILSKNVKLFIRKNKPRAHWHIQQGPVGADTFQSVQKIIDMPPEDFFRQIAGFSGNGAYAAAWRETDAGVEKVVRQFLGGTGFGEFKAVYEVMKALPPDCHLHLANSMPVRYANFAGLAESRRQIKVFGTRGASGIDGCSSFAVGDALVNGKMTVLITGDLAFFYDRNAFWHNYPLDNLRIILLNNHAGGIFRLLEGPAAQPELEEYFETRQLLKAQKTAEDYNFEYAKIDGGEALQRALGSFFNSGKRAKILEIETESRASRNIFDQFKTIIKEHL